MDDMNSNNNTNENYISSYNNYSNSEDRQDTVKISSFYTESYKNQKEKRNTSLFQLIIVALISSIFGGGIVFAAFQFVAPAVQPYTNSYFNKIINGNTTANTLASPQSNNGVYKKIEITQTESPVTAIAEKVSPSIVGIRITAKVQDFFGTREVPGEGSGIIVRSDGYIITNNHVIEGALSERSNKLLNGSKIEVYLPNQKDKPYVAQVVGRDPKTDLAVLKIDATGLPAAELGNSDDVKVGELAVAIGNPGGLEYMGSVTAGVISGLNRTVTTEDGKNLTYIQTDAAINPGNSGGALVNSQGQVIGINTVKVVAQGFEGLGFAIPMNLAKQITDNLIEFKFVKGRPYIGISIDPRFTEEIAKRYDVPMGLLVAEVSPLSGAYKAGIQRNDIITKFDDQPVKEFNDLEEIKNKHKPGDEVTVEVYRDGETLKLKVVLGEDKG